MIYTFTIPYFTWFFPILFVFSFSRNSSLRELTEGYNKSTFRIQTFSPYNYFLTIEAVFFSAIEAYIDELILPLTGQFKRLSYMRTSKISGVFNGIRSHDLCDASANTLHQHFSIYYSFHGNTCPQQIDWRKSEGLHSSVGKSTAPALEWSMRSNPARDNRKF